MNIRKIGLTVVEECGHGWKICIDCEELKSLDNYRPSARNQLMRLKYCSICLEKRISKAQKIARDNRRGFCVLDGYKYCGRCSEIKNLDYFSACSAHEDNKNIYCKGCLSDIRKENIDVIRGQQRQRYRKDITESRRKNNEYKHKISSTKPAPIDKKCSICQETKLIKDFYKCKMRPDGYDVRCKKCEQARKVDFHSKNKEKLNLKSRKYQKENKQKLNDKIKNDPGKSLGRRLRSRIWHALKRNSEIKEERTRELTGCNIEFLRKHLEYKFQLRYKHELDWDKFIKTADYEVDHIIPCEAFDLHNKEAQKFCFHYSNLEILLADENYDKSDFLFGIRARHMEEKLNGSEDWLKLKDWNQNIIKCK